MQNWYAIALNEWIFDTRIRNELPLLLYISSLTAEKWYCYASNEHFAEKFGYTTVWISNKIKKLEQIWYIEIEYEKRWAEIIKRYLRLKNNLIDDSSKLYSTIKENFKDNNTSNNITSINNIYNENFSNSHLQKQNKKSQEIEEVQISEEISEVDENKKTILRAAWQIKKTFLDLFENEITESFIGMLKVKYSLSDEQIKDIANNFILYRTEKNPNGKKERWEMQKTFDIKRRFYTWLNNDKRYNKRPQDTTWVVIIW